MQTISLVEQPSGIEDGIIRDLKVEGGCSGNLQGISALVKGMSVEEVIGKLSDKIRLKTRQLVQRFIYRFYRPIFFRRENLKHTESIAHLTCVNSTREDIDSIIGEFEQYGVENVLALRGETRQLVQRFIYRFYRPIFFRRENLKGKHRSALFEK